MKGNSQIKYISQPDVSPKHETRTQKKPSHDGSNQASKHIGDCRLAYTSYKAECKNRGAKW
jgi:hypothetical protein